VQGHPRHSRRPELRGSPILAPPAISNTRRCSYVARVERSDTRERLPWVSLCSTQATSIRQQHRLATQVKHHQVARIASRLRLNAT
jgi:hypothetical protein